MVGSMYRFRIPEVFLGCFLTIAVFATGMLFAWDGRYSGQPTRSNHSGEPEKPTSNKSDPKPFWENATTDPVAAFTLGLVFVGLFQAGLFFVQLRFMRKGMDDATAAANAASNSASAAIEANKINRDNFLADHRPWLGPSGAPNFVAPLSPVKGGYTTGVEINILNAGRSPAFKVHVVAELYLMDPKGGTLLVPERLKKKLVSFSEWGTGSLIFPESTTTRLIDLSLTDEDILANTYINGSMKAFYPMLWVGVTYSSSDGSFYTTSAIHIMRAAPIGMETPAEQLAVSLVHCEAT